MVSATIMKDRAAAETLYVSFNGINKILSSFHTLCIDDSPERLSALKFVFSTTLLLFLVLNDLPATR